MSPADPTPPAARDAPAAIGRYRLLERLAGSAQDVVYKGFDPLIERPLVITAFGLTDIDAAAAEAIRRAFFAEMPRLGLLTHAGIATLFDAGEWPDGLFLATEYVDGLSLADHLATAPPWPDADRVSLIVQIADALGYAGEQGVPHRRLKPTNVLLGADLAPVIRGFGATGVHDALAAARGVPPDRSVWAAPERQRGEPGDARADVYALARIARLVLGSLSGQPGSAPAETLAKAMSPDPDDRFDSVGAFKYALLLALGLDEMAVRTAWESVRHASTVLAADASTLTGLPHSAVQGDLTALANPSSISPTGAEEMVTRLAPADPTRSAPDPPDSA